MMTSSSAIKAGSGEPCCTCGCWAEMCFATPSCICICRGNWRQVALDLPPSCSACFGGLKRRFCGLWSPTSFLFHGFCCPRGPNREGCNRHLSVFCLLLIGKTCTHTHRAPCLKAFPVSSFDCRHGVWLVQVCTQSAPTVVSWMCVTLALSTASDSVMCCNPKTKLLGVLARFR